MNFDQILGRDEHEVAVDKELIADPLKAMKPWVFKPKKVLYRLSNNAPQNKEFSKYHWTPEQNKLYIAFLLKFKDIIQGQKKKKRKWHLNRIMSKFIKTRSHEQCRSHHQKMTKSYKSINGILEHFQNSNDSSSVDCPKQNQTRLELRQNQIQSMVNCFSENQNEQKQNILNCEQMEMLQYLNKPIKFEHQRQWQDMLDSF